MNYFRQSLLSIPLQYQTHHSVMDEVYLHSLDDILNQPLSLKDRNDLNKNYEQVDLFVKRNSIVAINNKKQKKLLTTTLGRVGTGPGKTISGKDGQSIHHAPIQMSNKEGAFFQEIHPADVQKIHEDNLFDYRLHMKLGKEQQIFKVEQVKRKQKKRTSLGKQCQCCGKQLFRGHKCVHSICQRKCGKPSLRRGGSRRGGSSVFSDSKDQDWSQQNLQQQLPKKLYQQQQQGILASNPKQKLAQKGNIQSRHSSANKQSANPEPSQYLLASIQKLLTQKTANIFSYKVISLGQYEQDDSEQHAGNDENMQDEDQMKEGQLVDQAIQLQDQQDQYNEQCGNKGDREGNLMLYPFQMIQLQNQLKEQLLVQRQLKAQSIQMANKTPSSYYRTNPGQKLIQYNQKIVRLTSSSRINQNGLDQQKYSECRQKDRISDIQGKNKMQSYESSIDDSQVWKEYQNQGQDQNQEDVKNQNQNQNQNQNADYGGNQQDQRKNIQTQKQRAISDKIHNKCMDEQSQSQSSFSSRVNQMADEPIGGQFIQNKKKVDGFKQQQFQRLQQQLRLQGQKQIQDLANQSDMQSIPRINQEQNSLDYQIQEIIQDQHDNDGSNSNENKEKVPRSQGKPPGTKRHSQAKQVNKISKKESINRKIIGKQMLNSQQMLEIDPVQNYVDYDKLMLEEQQQIKKQRKDEKQEYSGLRKGKGKGWGKGRFMGRGNDMFQQGLYINQERNILESSSQQWQQTLKTWTRPVGVNNLRNDDSNIKSNPSIVSSVSLNQPPRSPSLTPKRHIPTVSTIVSKIKQQAQNQKNQKGLGRGKIYGRGLGVLEQAYQIQMQLQKDRNTIDYHQLLRRSKKGRKMVKREHKQTQSKQGKYQQQDNYNQGEKQIVDKFDELIGEQQQQVEQQKQVRSEQQGQECQLNLYINRKQSKFRDNDILVKGISSQQQQNQQPQQQQQGPDVSQRIMLPPSCLIKKNLQLPEQQFPFQQLMDIFSDGQFQQQLGLNNPPLNQPQIQQPRDRNNPNQSGFNINGPPNQHNENKGKE